MKKGVLILSLGAFVLFSVVMVLCLYPGVRAQQNPYDYSAYFTRPPTTTAPTPAQSTAPVETAAPTPVQSTAATETVAPTPTEPATSETTGAQTEPPTEPVVAEPYASPVDFAALRKVNTDIYAWLDIPGTAISYPIHQHAGDDSYYHRRNMRGGYDINGSVYTEASYNGLDFEDPVTVIYGHNMASGVMFGTLEKEYSSAQALTEKQEIVIYLPDCEYHYTVFAAVPFDNRHILYNHDFSSIRTFRLFFRDILAVRELEAVFAEGASVANDDHVIILSTCLTRNDQNRFLVCAKRTQIVPN